MMIAMDIDESAIPEGYRAVAYRPYKDGDTCIGYEGVDKDPVPATFEGKSPTAARIIIEKIFDLAEFWGKVPVDTKVWVKDYDHHEWVPWHFVGFKDLRFVTVDGAGTSFSNPDSTGTTWKYCELDSTFGGKPAADHIPEGQE